MNNKIQIWKRKLAKEKLIQKLRVWEELKRDHSLPKFSILEDPDLFGAVNKRYGVEMVSDFSNQMLTEVNNDILKKITPNTT